MDFWSVSLLSAWAMSPKWKLCIKPFSQMNKCKNVSMNYFFVFRDPSGIQSPLIANDTFILLTGRIWGQSRVQFGREAISSCQSTRVYGQLKQFRLNKIFNKVHPKEAKQCDLFSSWPWFPKTILSIVLLLWAICDKSYIPCWKLLCGKTILIKYYSKKPQSLSKDYSNIEWTKDKQISQIDSL